MGRAIQKNLAEVDVAPLSLRLLALFGVVSPSLAAVQRRIGGDKITEQPAEGQRSRC